MNKKIGSILAYKAGKKRPKMADKGLKMDNKQKSFTIDEKKYFDAMKQLGIKTTNLPEYTTSESFGRSFKKVSIQKQTHIAMTSSVSM